MVLLYLFRVIYVSKGIKKTSNALNYFRTVTFSLIWKTPKQLAKYLWIKNIP